MPLYTGLHEKRIAYFKPIMPGRQKFESRGKCTPVIYLVNIYVLVLFFLVKLVKRRDNNHTSGTKWAENLVFCGCLF